MASFDLVDEPWIPCLLPDGSPRECSLEEVLLDAHRIREVFDSSPLVTAALHRLLLAILHRNFGPASPEQWMKLWAARRWDAHIVSGYLDRWRHRFDLFDATRPFYQVPEMPNVRTSPATRLVMEAASGNNPTLFDHSTDATPRPLSPAEAARYLLACQYYSIGFGKSRPFYLQDSPLTRGLTVHAMGRNLFETLALNLLPYSDERPLPRVGDDLPAWEQEAPAQPDPDGTRPNGYLDYLTWQSRRIHLVPEGNPTLVPSCQFLQGLKLGGDPLDPFKCYRRDEKAGLRPVGIDADRALWRESHTLFQEADRSYRRPEVFNWLAQIDGWRRRALVEAEPSYAFACFGFASEPGRAASVTLWRHERLPLPLIYLWDKRLLGRLKDALDLAEGVGRLLLAGFDEDPSLPSGHHPRPVQLLCSLLLSSTDATRADSGAVRQLASHLAPGRVYWSRLEVPFCRLLVRLAEDVVVDEEGEPQYGRSALPEWAATLRRAALVAFDQVATALDGSARALKARAVAEREFRQQLHAILKNHLTTEEEV